MSSIFKNSISSVDEDLSAVLSIDELRWLAAIDSPIPEATLTPIPTVATAAPGALPTRVAAKPNSSQTKSTLAGYSPSLAHCTPSQGLTKPTSDVELELDPETCSLYVETQCLYTDLDSSSGTHTSSSGRLTSTPRSSPPSSYKRPTPISKLDLSTHAHPMRVQSPAPHRNRHYRLGEPSLIPIHLPFARNPSPATTPFTSSIPIPSLASTSSHSSHLSRSLPTSSTRRPEWIYRHPKPRNPSSPLPTISPPNITSLPTAASPPSPSRTRTRSSTSRNKPRPQTGYLPRSAQSKPLPPSPKHAGTGQAFNPFWSSILRQRPRSRRSIPALKAVSSSQISASSHSASAAPPPVPAKSSSHPAFHVRTPSTSSTASTGSAYSTNTLSTTTASSSPLAPTSSIKAPTPPASTSKPTRTRLHSSSSSSSSGSTGTASSSTTATSSSPPHTPNSTPFPSRPPAHPFPISSSCPSPAKSILTRSSSVSTAGKHSLASGTGTHSASLLSCASKSVTFVDAPTVHYHDAGSWGIERVEEEVYGDILDASIDHSSDGGDIRMPGLRRYEADLDSDMGLDVEGMDMDMDTENGSFSTHTNDSLQSKGLKRLISLSRKTPPTTRPSRPTISGPFALGSLPDTPGRSSSPARSTHSFRSASTCSPSLRSTPSVRSTHSVGHTHKSTHLKAHSYSHPAKPRMPYPASMHSLRAEPSCESLGRSVRSLGSVKSTTSTRGFRTWLAKIGTGLGLAGVGWEP